jgi:3'-5' exoribonuclease
MTAPRTVSTAASAASAAPIASSISLATAPVGTPIEHMVVALIKKKLGQTKAGDPMLTLEFGDADGGRIGAKVWKQDVPTWDAISEGMAVTVTGKVKAGFQGGPPEFSIERVGEAFAAHPVLEGMLPKYEGDLGELRKRFLAIISTIEHPGLLKFVRAVFKDACPFEAFTAAPAALGHHHAMKHGLLLHTTQVAENALHLAQTPEYAPHVQRDLLAAQAVLHDIGKVEEITTSPVGFSFSLKGRLYGHVVSGLLMLERTWTAHRAELEPLGMSESIMEHLRHGIASHHGQKEWGATAEPATIEAVLLHQADLASARAQSVIEYTTTGLVTSDGTYENRSRRHGFGVVQTPELRVASLPSETVEGSAPRVRASDVLFGTPGTPPLASPTASPAVAPAPAPTIASALTAG